MKLCEDELHKRLSALGVEEITDPKALRAFLEGYDFMKLGQAINRGQWNSAMMILQRMDASVQKLGIRCMIQPLKTVRLAVLGRNVKQAKQAQAALIGKRVQLIKCMKEWESEGESQRE
ncbi:MAG: hypothetical protein IKV27_02955 [Lachnospiraceae bacterium]|nr:hypothetical protein [Lachnospiraceae bacterium]